MRPLSRIFLSLYELLWLGARPILQRHHRLREGFTERLVPRGWGGGNTSQATKRLWIQAASGGEALLVEALAQALSRALIALNSLQNPTSLDIFCTTCTRQGMDVLERVAKIALPYIHIIPAYFPLDAPSCMRRALRETAPDAIVLLETELWPGLLAAAITATIPLGIANARMTPKSASGYRYLRQFFSQTSPKNILATTPEDAQRFSALFPQSIVTRMNNIKFDLAQKMLLDSETSSINTALASPQTLAHLPQKTPLILFASLRKEEEPLLEPVLVQLLSSSCPKNTTPLIILAPRHLHRIAHWQERLNALSISYSLRSKQSFGTNPVQVLLWDSFGEMPHLYQACDAVFVGGSLAPLGGQNFLEPLCHGKVALVGPSCYNFSWVGESIIDDQLLLPITSSIELAPALLHYLTLTSPGALYDPMRVKQRFKKWLTPHLGGAEQATLTILDLLDIRQQQF